MAPAVFQSESRRRRAAAARRHRPDGAATPPSPPPPPPNPNTLSARLADLHRRTLADDDATTTTVDTLYQAFIAEIREKSTANDDATIVPAEPATLTSSWPSRCSPAVLAIVALVGVALALLAIVGQPLIAYVLGIRCFVPNNYLVWEATRPVTDCAYCRSVRRPLILPNMTREEFLPYAYSVQPIILKRAVAHWTAAQTLNFTWLRRLYRRNNAAALRAYHDECQFLNFQSNFLTLERFFAMPAERAASGQPPWYVGFSNCQSTVLHELRRLYPIPHFLPDDAEVPNTDYVFMGFDRGAIMHLDYIPRLMWQAQLRGTKRWSVAPTPECRIECEAFGFYVEPGDAVLMDTRIWYHATSVLNGEFSLTVQSEYG